MWTRALPLTNIATQTEQIERRFAQERLFANAYALFGALALTLASIGLFGLMSYNVSRRTNEIGIRMALGAGGHTVARMVLRESLLVVAVGVAIGLAVALAAGRLRDNGAVRTRAHRSGHDDSRGSCSSWP